MKKKVVHKVDKWLEAACRSYYSGSVIPDVSFKSRTWTKVTCKSCLRRKGK